MNWAHAPRCPRCGWLFYLPPEQRERIFCRACETVRANG